MEQAENIYLDNAAATFLLPVVRDHIAQWVSERIANPSSIHGAGRSAASLLDNARQETASVLGCQAGEIIFTSGGTEANNLAISGMAESLHEQGRHIITCQTEHPSVLESCKRLESKGFEVTYLSTDSLGRIDLDELRNSITDRTILISLMWVNNETGLIHPVRTIAGIAEEHGVKFHCDAAQALGHLPFRADEISLDAMTFSAHKIGAPGGLGVLYLRKGSSLQKQIQGGSQEGNHRAGTQNVLGASAFAKAVRFHFDHFREHDEHFKTLLERLQQRLSKIPGVQINRGNADYSPHILNCSCHAVDGEALFIRLDMQNISVSNGAACSSGSQTPSHVLSALGINDSLAQASLRISPGVDTHLTEIDRFCDDLEDIIRMIRRESG